MTTRTTFEDRLLVELRGEIARRETELREIEREEIEWKEEDRLARAGAARRRLFTGGRLALAAGACAAAGLAVVLVPGTPVDSPAYAVEKHDDGSVTLSLVKIGIGPQTQHRLAERLRAEGVHVTIDDLPYGERCAQPRGELLSAPMERGYIGDEPPDGDDIVAPAGLSRQWQVTLRPGDSLGIENMTRKDGTGVPTELFYAVKGEIKPCEPESAP
jgi:hypothetical protein